MERAVPILPVDDLSVAKDFYATKLGFEVLFEVSDDGKNGLLGLARGTIRITLDSPMDGHGRNACVAPRGCRARRAPSSRGARSSAGARSSSEGAHPVVLRVVGELRQAQGLEQRRHVDAEAAAQTLLQAVPATHRIRV